MCPLDNVIEILLPEIAPFSTRTQNASSTFLMVLVLTRIVSNRKCPQVAHTMQYTAFPIKFLFSIWKHVHLVSVLTVNTLSDNEETSVINQCGCHIRGQVEWDYTTWWCRSLEPGWLDLCPGKLPLTHIPGWQLVLFKPLSQQNLKLLQVRSLQQKRRAWCSRRTATTNVKSRELDLAEGAHFPYILRRKQHLF